MQDSIENIQPEELNGDATSPTTSVETSADDEKKQLSDIDNSAKSAESSTTEKKKRQRNHWSRNLTCILSRNSSARFSLSF